MVRATVSVVILLGGLLALAKYTVTSDVNDARGRASVDSAGNDGILRDRDPQPTVTRPTRSATLPRSGESAERIRFENVSPVRLAAYEERIEFGDEDTDGNSTIRDPVRTARRLGRRVSPPVFRNPLSARSKNPGEQPQPISPGGERDKIRRPPDETGNRPTTATPKSHRTASPSNASRPDAEDAERFQVPKSPAATEKYLSDLIHSERSGTAAADPTTAPDIESGGQPAASHDAAKPRPDQESTSSQQRYQVPPGADPWYAEPEPMTQAMVSRRQRIRQCLEFYYSRPLNSREHSPWSIMHTIIAWGVDAQIAEGGPNGRRVSAIRWLCNNGVSDGVQLLYVKDGQLRARMGGGLQGHVGQFLAILAQARVRRDFPIKVGKHQFTVDDLIEVEKAGCRPRTELTFKLIGLAHYLDPDEQWKDDRGETWSIPRLIREEIAQPINGVTCGGTHRLMGLDYAVRRREYDGKPVDGQWARARKYTADYQNYALSLQNRDGTLSSNFFRGRANWGDLNRKMKTTGHMLEWLIFSLPHERLQDRRVTHAVDTLCQTMMQNRYYKWDKGPIGHGIRVLSLYDERVYGQRPGQRIEQMAKKRRSSTR